MVNSEKVLEIILEIASCVDKHKDYLTELDQPIGDSDHGINLARGFEAVRQKADAMKGQDIGGILKNIDGDGTVLNVSGGTGMGMDADHYKNILIAPMAYGQSLTILALAEALTFVE